MYAPYTPIEFVDASHHDGSAHTLLFVRVTGAVKYAQHPDPAGFVVPPPEDDGEWI